MSIPEQKKRVIFCDDDHDLLQTLGQAAIAMNLDAHLFSKPAELVANITRIQPHLIVSDIDMPDLNGFELIKRLKMTDAIFPFIFLSGHATLENFRHGLLEGQFDFLSKPVDFETLQLAIQKALTFGASLEPVSPRLLEFIELAFIMSGPSSGRPPYS